MALLFLGFGAERWFVFNAIVIFDLFLWKSTLLPQRYKLTNIVGKFQTIKLGNSIGLRLNSISGPADIDRDQEM